MDKFWFQTIVVQRLQALLEARIFALVLVLDLCFSVGEGLLILCVCVCVFRTWFGSMVALVHYQTVHTFKLPVLDLSSPQGRDQDTVLGPVDR